MRVAYLVLAHNTPNHLKRLVAALNSPNASFYIHVDRKSNIQPFLFDAPNVLFLADRMPIYWGDFSVVRATIRLIETALCDRPDYCCLISGSDYPIRSAEYIERFLALGRNRQYMAMVRIPCPERGKPLSRVQAYRFPIPYNHALARRAMLWLHKSIPRRSYKGITPYAGSQWWALTRDACQYIVRFIDTHPDFVKFFARVPVPDESFFHTIIGNSEFRGEVVRNLTYCDWSAGGSNPASLGPAHLEVLTKIPLIAHDEYYGSGELLFARKFPDSSEALVAALRAPASTLTEASVEIPEMISAPVIVVSENRKPVH